MLEQGPWDHEFGATCDAVPWQLKFDQRRMWKPCSSDAEQGFAPNVLVPAARRVDRRRYFTKRDLAKYGYIDDCLGCAQLAVGMGNASVLQDDRCRGRVGEITAGDDDPRKVERVSSDSAPDAENPRPLMLDETVSEPPVPPAPANQVGGSSSSAGPDVATNV